MSKARRERLEARLGHASPWPLYAVITGSALTLTAAPLPHNAPNNSPHNAPIILAVRRAMAGPHTQAVAQAVQNGPVINAGGVVPVYSTMSMIQPGEWVSIFGTKIDRKSTRLNSSH